MAKWWKGIVACLIGWLHADDSSCYLFASFRDSLTRPDGISGLHLAYSVDGFNFTDITHEQPTYYFKNPISGEEERVPFPLVGEKIFRDPSITCDDNGVFHMVWTASWQQPYFGHSSSHDLIHWEDPVLITLKEVHDICMFWGEQRESMPLPSAPIQIASWEEVQGVWAPNIFFDIKSHQYIIVWASKKSADEYMKLYYTTTQNFISFSPPQLLFDPGYDIIDGTIVYDGRHDTYYLIFKDERLIDWLDFRLAKNIRIARSSSGLCGPFIDMGRISTNFFIEGPSVIKIKNIWYLYYDFYFGAKYLPTQHYGACVSTNDLASWYDIAVSFPYGTRHGSSVAIKPLALHKLLVFFNPAYADIKSK